MTEKISSTNYIPTSPLSQGKEPDNDNTLKIDDEGQETAVKIYFWVQTGKWFVIVASLICAGGVGIIVYGLVERVSMSVPVCACTVTACVFGLIGTTLMNNGQNMPTLTSFRASFFSSSIVRGQRPGLRNEGNTCFINGSLQALFRILPYRKALHETAQKELSYLAAWLKLQEAVVLAKETPWSPDEIKGVLITLARQAIQLNGYLNNEKLTGNAFIATLKEFDDAENKGLAWPAIEDLTSSLKDCIEFFKEHAQDYFKAQLDDHKNCKDAFEALFKGIENYSSREAMLQGDVSHLKRDDIVPPTEISLKYLRAFLGTNNSWRQEDADEFITKLLSHVRACEYPNLFPHITVCKQLAPFVTEDKEINDQIASKLESIKNPLEKLPPNAKIEKNSSDLIRLTCPTLDSDITGQQLLDDWLSIVSAEELSDKEKSKNLVFYEEGAYFISHEGQKIDPTDYVVIQLKRFAYNHSSEKITTQVLFTEELQLQGQKYRVIAITIHHGPSAKGGHYTAVVRDQTSNEWWLCDDHQVSQATPDELSHAMTEGYLYFLEKVSEQAVEQPDNVLVGQIDKKDNE